MKKSFLISLFTVNNFALLLLFGFPSATSANPQKGVEAPVCAFYLTHREFLKSVGEKPTFRGLSKRGHVTEVWLDDKTGKWTAVVTYSTGKMCTVDYGNTGDQLPLEKGDPS